MVFLVRLISLNVFFAGIPDRLFKNSYYRNDYEDVNGRGYKLKDGSCCTYGYNFVLAIPKTITFKNKWGGMTL